MTATPKDTPNLYQRLQAVESAIGGVEPTGNNQYQKKAISIEDAENAIRDLLAEHGIVTRWRDVPDSPCEDLGSGKLWRTRGIVRVVNVDNPTEDFFEDEWSDIGGNPSAARSFMRKGYYKALFHMAEPEDEAGQNTVTTQRTQAATRQQQPKPAQSPPDRPATNDNGHQAAPDPKVQAEAEAMVKETVEKAVATTSRQDLLKQLQPLVEWLNRRNRCDSKATMVEIRARGQLQGGLDAWGVEELRTAIGHAVQEKANYLMTDAGKDLVF